MSGPSVRRLGRTAWVDGSELPDNQVVRPAVGDEVEEAQLAADFGQEPRLCRVIESFRGEILAVGVYDMESEVLCHVERCLLCSAANEHRDDMPAVGQERRQGGGLGEELANLLA